MSLRNQFAGSAVAVAAALAVLLAAGASRAAGDVDKGKAAFVRQCAVCHTIDKGDPNRYGPNLAGIVGKKAASAPDFDYSRAFKNSAKWEWTEDALGSWIMFPGTMVPGTAMAIFQGVAEKDRDDIVAYLASKK
jgi:cytochrome c